MKLICKNLGFISRITITPGKYYDIKESMLLGMLDAPWPLYPYSLDDDNGDNWSLSNNPKSKFYIWDYFYTPQETRKMKLQKINETTV